MAAILNKKWRELHLKTTCHRWLKFGMQLPYIIVRFINKLDFVFLQKLFFYEFFHFRHDKQMRWPTLICIFCEHMEQICKTALSTLEREWWWYTVTNFKLFYWKITKWDSVEVSWINTEHVFEKIAFKVYKHRGTMYNIKKHIKMDNTLQKCPPNCPPTHGTIIRSLQFTETNIIYIS